MNRKHIHIFRPTKIYYKRFSLFMTPFWCILRFKILCNNAGSEVLTVLLCSVVYRGGGLRGSNPPPKFGKPSKIMPKSNRWWKLLKTAEFRTPSPQDVSKKDSKILKLPSVRSCFTLAMINKLVVIINSLKVLKIKKILLYEMKFLVPNYSRLQNPWLGGYCPQIPVLSVLRSQLSLLTSRTKFLGTPLLLLKIQGFWHVIVCQWVSSSRRFAR